MTPEQGIRFQVRGISGALIFALIINVAGLVWGAAKITAAVESVQATAAKLEVTLYQVSASVQDLRERVGVLEDRDQRARPYPPRTPRAIP